MLVLFGFGDLDSFHGLCLNLKSLVNGKIENIFRDENQKISRNQAIGQLKVKRISPKFQFSINFVCT